MPRKTDPYDEVRRICLALPETNERLSHGEPTFFIRDAGCLTSLEQIVHFDLHSKQETESYSSKLASSEPIVVGITAGASCPNNLIEDTILRVFKLRGIDETAVMAAARGE